MVTAAVVAGGFALLTYAERRHPLRRRTTATLPRAARNIAMGAIALIGTVWGQPSGWPATKKRWLLNLPSDLILLDYSLWWWHRANHEWTALWRFHLVHHIDRDMDASTAFRFHFGEQLLSLIYRRLQVGILRPSPNALWLWQTILFASILFHHSNLRLPESTEARLVRWIVTPRMHGIHHSQVNAHSRSNYSSILNWWDGVHGTLLLDVPQETLSIGVPGYTGPDQATLTSGLALPFHSVSRSEP